MRAFSVTPPQPKNGQRPHFLFFFFFYRFFLIFSAKMTTFYGKNPDLTYPEHFKW